MSELFQSGNVYKYSSNVDIFSVSLTAPTAHASNV